jgi:hypothetical protein
LACLIFNVIELLLLLRMLILIGRRIGSVLNDDRNEFNSLTANPQKVAICNAIPSPKLVL